MSREHKHNFIFLRQETRNIGYDRNPTWKTEDVYFCSECLEYKRIEVDTHYKESSEWERHQYDRRY